MSTIEQHKKKDEANEIKDGKEEPITRPKRDWFGYLFTTVIGVVVTVFIAWYQIYISESQAATAEIERSRAVKQSAVAITEEHVLNSKKIEVDRLIRLIDQRRRDQKVAIPITALEVVEQAEFNIASSTYLSISRKEEIKTVFDDFYREISAAKFKPFSADVSNSDIFNSIAKQIQDGKTAEALADLTRLQEAHEKEISQISRSSAAFSVASVFNVIATNPLKFSVLIAIYIAIVYALWRTMQRRRFNRITRRDSYRPL